MAAGAFSLHMLPARRRWRWLAAVTVPATLLFAAGWWLLADVPDPTGPIPWSVQRTVKQAVDRRLKDPDSARYEFLFYEHGTYLCGTVNAKNGYGAYAGAELFFVETIGDVAVHLLFTSDGPEAARACDVYRPRPVPYTNSPPERPAWQERR